MGLENLSKRPLPSVLWGLVALIGLILLGMNIASWVGANINGWLIGWISTSIGIAMILAGGISLSDISSDYK